MANLCYLIFSFVCLGVSFQQAGLVVGSANNVLADAAACHISNFFNGTIFRLKAAGQTQHNLLNTSNTYLPLHTQTYLCLIDISHDIAVNQPVGIVQIFGCFSEYEIAILEQNWKNIKYRVIICRVKGFQHSIHHNMNLLAPLVILETLLSM